MPKYVDRNNIFIIWNNDRITVTQNESGSLVYTAKNQELQDKVTVL